jgi:hypothetical protein
VRCVPIAARTHARTHARTPHARARARKHFVLGRVLCGGEDHRRLQIIRCSLSRALAALVLGFAAQSNSLRTVEKAIKISR